MSKIKPQDLLKIKKDKENLIATLRAMGFSEMDVGEAINEDGSYLGLGRSKIDDTGAAFLAQGLKGNTSLTRLYLSVNKISDTGAEALGKMLKSNTSLTELHLDFNKIGDTGIGSLAERLKDNTSLTRLYLDNNKIGYKGAEALLEALKVNKAITTLSVYGNNFTKELRISIEAQVESNEQLVNQIVKFIAENISIESTEIEKIKGISVLNSYNKVSKFALEDGLKKSKLDNYEQILKNIDDYFDNVIQNIKTELNLFFPLVLQPLVIEYVGTDFFPEPDLPTPESGLIGAADSVMEEIS